jgi:hypothetical protein
MINLETKETPAQKHARAVEIAQITAGAKTPNEIELIRKAQAGDKEAAATLAELQKRRIEASSASGAARAEGFGNIRQLMIIDPVTKQPRFANANEINEMNKSGVQPQPAQQNLEQITKVAEAKVPGSQRAASVRTAATVMKQEVPEIISLRGIVKAKNLLPTGGFKDLESVNQWVMAKASDPDTALLKKKVKMLADNLQRTIGGSQGGEWAFKVAADILDPSFDTPAFTRIVNSHTETLNRMANAYKNYGKDVDPKTEKAIAELIRRGKTVNEQTISQALKLIGE